MNNILTLIKYNLINNLRLNKLSKKFKIGVVAVAPILYLALLLLIFGYFYMMFFGFKELGEELSVVINFSVTISMFIVLINAISQSTSYIFKSRDYDFLLSLPVKSSEIIIAKLSSIYILDLVFTSLIMLGGLACYFVLTSFNYLILIYYIITMFFIPLIPLLIGGLLSFLIGFIPLSDKVKNLILSLIIVVVAIVIVIFSFTSTDSTNYLGAFNILQKVFIFADWQISGTSNVLYFILFVGSSLLALGLFVLIANIGRTKLHRTNNNSNLNYNIKKEKYHSSKGCRSALIKKELRQYISTPVLLTNTIIGPLLSIVMVVFLVINKDKLGSLIQGVSPEKAQNLIIIGLISMTIMAVTLAPTTAVQISLEGKSFWHLKVFPITYKDIVISKLALSFVVAMPAVIINGIVSVIFLGLDIIASIALFLVPTLLVIAFSIIGLFINLKFPKFDYDNPAKVVKQGLSTGLTVLFSFITFMLVSVTSLVLWYLFDVAFIPYVAMLGLAFIVFIIAIIIIKVSGKKAFDIITY